ncbi:hypothetical protein [Pedobacter sp. SYSU D00535]|uniref:hypothetical protein n=1 Tax=Pedobacter sp. SYSU D00535 TaxID=2810308 RepID=UPI001A968B19|nr:hypothetical protein [Pedobacter sp. SYSU D00535]
MGKKSKKLKRKVQKAVGKEISLQISSFLDEIAEKLGTNSKKTSRRITKVSRTIAASLVEKMDIDFVTKAKSEESITAPAEPAAPLTPVEQVQPTGKNRSAKSTVAAKTGTVKIGSQQTAKVAEAEV